MVTPVSQNFMTFNGLIGEVEQMILEREPWLQLSESPLWPWMFGNCRIEESGNGNRRGEGRYRIFAEAEERLPHHHGL